MIDGHNGSVRVIKSSEKFGLRLQYDDRADRKYQVVVDDEIVYATNVETSALTEYQDLLAERDKPYAERRKREADFKLGAALQAERVSRTSSQAARSTGGKGGRGGV